MSRKLTDHGPHGALSGGATLNIYGASATEADAFALTQWPRYNADAGIAWDFFRGGLIAESGGKTLGVATYNVIGGVAHLGQIIVDHDHARKGIGSQIYVAFEEDCQARGCHKMTLETAQWQAREFYEHHGWEVFHTLENDKFGRRWFLMHKML